MLNHTGIVIVPRSINPNAKPTMCIIAAAIISAATLPRNVFSVYRDSGNAIGIDTRIVKPMYHRTIIVVILSLIKHIKNQRNEIAAEKDTINHKRDKEQYK